jgi:glyoxylase-like metal-dependent hydrolase (beta-lactamase superfamily II)
MNIHAISTGRVKITQSWRVGQDGDALRLAHTLFDRRFTDWLPIFCYVVEHPEGLLVIDTGIPANANDPVWFPPWMRLVQRAAYFDQMTPEEEIGPQLQKRGLSIKDVRWVVLTHLHQDHDGGLHHFPNAEILVATAEWEAATGLKGRLGGYLNQRWPKWLSPTLIDFKNGAYGAFSHSHRLTERGDVHLVSTPGHSAGHLSVMVEEDDHMLCFAGDASYSQELLLADAIDGVGPDPFAQHQTHKQILQFSSQTPMIYLPAHEWDAERRLSERETVPSINR